MAVIFSYGIDTMVLPENIMSYSTQIGRRPSKYFQWYNIENPSDYHFPFTDNAEDGELEYDKEKEKELKELTQRVVEEIFNTELYNGNNIVYYKTESQYNEENNNENKEVEGL